MAVPPLSSLSPASGPRRLRDKPHRFSRLSCLTFLPSFVGSEFTEHLLSTKHCPGHGGYSSQWSRSRPCLVGARVQVF